MTAGPPDFSLRTNQPPATSQQYFSLRTNQHQPPATSQTNRLEKVEHLPCFPQKEVIQNSALLLVQMEDDPIQFQALDFVFPSMPICRRVEKVSVLVPLDR
jgi:hypothetical protein